MGQSELPAYFCHDTLETLAVPLLIADTEGVILWVNQAFTELTGYTLEEVVGRNPRILKSGLESPSLYNRLWRTIKAGLPWRGELVNRKKDGSLYAEAMTITPVIIEDEIKYFVAVKIDISARRQLEHTLLLLLAYFEEILSNECIQGRNELDELLPLLRSLLTLSGSTPNRSPTAPEKICRNCIREIHTQAQAAGLPVCVEVDAIGSLETDPERLTELLTWLLRLALRWSQKESRILLAMEGEPGSEHIKFRVGENLCLPAWTRKLRPEIKPDTLQLGLDLARRLALLLGGNLTIKEHSFEVCLPWVVYRETEPGDTEAAPVVPPSKRKETLLVVDDNPVGLRTVSDFFEAKGFTVFRASSGPEAIELTIQHQPDLIIMDIQMPHMDGYEAIRRIRNLDPPPRTRIMALTALAMKGDRQRCLDAGADTYLARPTRLKDLAQAVEEQLALLPP